MPLRPCLGCRKPTEGSRCPVCRTSTNRERDARRGTTAERGYDAQHQAERVAWQRTIDELGGVPCRRAASGQCVSPGPLILPGETWHLGHPDASCPAPKAPEHVLCNTGAPRRRLP